MPLRLAGERFFGCLLIILLTLVMGSCQSAYYGAMEKIGYEKRDILVDRVDDARDAQQDAREQFEDALEQFIAVTNYSGGDLEKQYRKLKSEYEDSSARAEQVRDRIASVDRVAQDLFTEWERELDQYSSQELRRTSANQLRDTRARYQELIKAMRRAEAKMEPVLVAFRDRVLFLKHNLNARAIAALRTQRAAVEADIAALVREMNQSIAAADRFIKDMSVG